MRNLSSLLDGETESTEKQKEQLKANIKLLQRDLVEASFKQSNVPESYSDLLLAINTERAKLRKLSLKFE